MKLSVALLLTFVASSATDSACNQGLQSLLAPLADYPAAQAFCKAKFPPSTVTVTVHKKRAQRRSTTSTSSVTKSTTTCSTRPSTTRTSSSSKKDSRDALMSSLLAGEYAVASRFCSCHQAHPTITKTTSTTDTTSKSSSTTSSASRTAATTIKVTTTTTTTIHTTTRSARITPTTTTPTTTTPTTTTFTTMTSPTTTSPTTSTTTSTTTTTVVTTETTTTLIPTTITTTSTSSCYTITPYAGPTCGYGYGAPCSQAESGTTYISCCPGYSCFTTLANSYCMPTGTAAYTPPVYSDPTPITVCDGSTPTTYTGPTCGTYFDPCRISESGSTYISCCTGFACFSTNGNSYCTASR